MQQVLWHDTIFDAIGAGVQAAGGNKKVSSKLWPALDPDTAVPRLRAGINPEHAQKLCIEEILMIAKLAGGRQQRHHRIYGSGIGLRVKPLTPAETKKRAKKQRVAALLTELGALVGDDD